MSAFDPKRTLPCLGLFIGLNHLAFRVKGRSLVDSLRQYCLDNNITCLYDERYPFANGGNDYYALYIEDPDRIKVEFVAT